jgi:hypothetical protein
MPDYNPDKERHRDHKYVVQKALRRDFRTKIKHGNEDLKFDKNGRFLVSDEAKAREIQKLHPRDLAVTRINTPKPSDRGHKYFFQVPAMPWHETEE